MQVDDSYNYMDTCGLPNIYTFSPAALVLWYIYEQGLF